MNHALIILFLKLLESYKKELSLQEYRNIRGQFISGDYINAQKGLEGLFKK